MSLRILALGDAHFMTNNVTEMRVFLDKLKSYLDLHKDDIDIFINLGDTLDHHNKLDIAPLNQAIEYIKLLCSYKPTYILVGNHDSINNSIHLTTDHWLNCLKEWPNLTVVDNVIIKEYGKNKIVLCPYVFDGKFINALNTKKGEWEDSSCIFSHITIKGANMGSVIAQEADTWPSDNPMLISGHIHLKQWLAPNMYYTGSIMQVACDESPDKSIALVNITDKIVRIEEIILDLPKKVMLYKQIQDIDEFEIPNEPMTKYTLYLTGTYEEFNSFRKSSKYKELIKCPSLGKRIRYKPNVQKKYNAPPDKTQQKFHDMLLSNIVKENDDYMSSLYQHLLDNEREDLSELMDQVLILKIKNITTINE